MKIVLDPYEASNKYIELIKQAILKLNVEIYRLSDVKENEELFYEIDFFVLNWYESLYVDSFLRQSKRYFDKIHFLKKIEKNKKKLVFVMHNKRPHNSKYAIWGKKIMIYLIKKSYKIVIHSEETREVISEMVNYSKVKNKIVHIPHPNYIGVYKDVEEKNIKDKEHLNLLFIGKIQPYKNVDLLIEVFNELNLKNVRLTLAGKVNTAEYEEHINALIGNNKNITKEFRFIEDDEMQNFISKSDMLILPYDIQSSLNSGTIILAFSSRKTVLSPLIGTLKDFKNKDKFFSYTYTDKESHKKELKEKLLQIYELYKRDKNIIEDMGNECYSMVKCENSLEKVTQAYKTIFFNEDI